MVSKELLESIFLADTTEKVHEIGSQIAKQLSQSHQVNLSPGNRICFERLAAGASDKKSGFARESSVIAYYHMVKECQLTVLPHIFPILPVIFEMQVGDKGQVVKDACRDLVNEIVMIVPSVSIKGIVLPLVFEVMEKGKWPAKISAVNFLAKLVARGDPLVCHEISRSLSLIIPVVSNCMHDTRSEVSAASISAMKEIVRVVGNPDIEGVLPDLVQCMANPMEVENCIEKLSKTTFVAEVTNPTLAVMVPLLARALTNRSSVTVRRTVIIINNLCKMVKNTQDAGDFLPVLLPGLNQLVEHAAFPEIRSLSQTAKETLIKVGGGGGSGGLKENEEMKMSSSDDKMILSSVESLKVSSDDDVIREKLISAMKIFPGDPHLQVAFDFVVKLVSALLNARMFYKKEWQSILGILETPEIVDPLHQFFVQLDRSRHPEECGDDGDEEDEGEVLCDCDFSLAYGGMLLLNHTRLRLLRGRRYALLGHNGAGKSTLMRSIAQEKLDGFPSAQVLKTVFVEHALQGEDTSLQVVDFVCSDSKLAHKSRDEIQKALEEVGFQDHLFEVSVSGLSGGWKMKLELARAMLLNADILLLDEPTNHLDVTNVAWLEQYLLNQKHITCLIVSHDSGFLDNVCTDIIHYENKKLFHYKGSLEAFVKRKPEAKSYYTLSSSNVKFVFPKPGFLLGVRSNTKAILKMTDISFCYPGSERIALQTFSGNISLSSRIGIIGKNGAGKSTLIKVMTGEYQPSTGVVWKHPNLRIGYVAQYAFHHLEEHLNETPFQYLRWRYQGGEDREVLLKDTRKFSEQDEAQMQKEISIDGEPRRIEYLFGRSKLKKSFQYEIKWVGKAHKFNTWMPRDKLLELGYQKIVQAFDDHESSREGLGYRELTQTAITQHFDDVGLDPKIAENNSISSLSGGQKVKVVIAACMWNNPHLLVLDEPTNFLDRDSLGGLAVAIRDWGGAVVMISHNEEFIKALCPETWYVESGAVTKKGKSAVESGNFEDSIGATGSSADSVTSLDSASNPEKMPKARKKKKLTRNEAKAKEARFRERKLKWLIEGGTLIYDSDEGE